jgi:hypothetical protein
VADIDKYTSLIYNNIDLSCKRFLVKMKYHLKLCIKKSEQVKKDDSPDIQI